MLTLVPWYWTSGCSPHLKRRWRVTGCSMILDVRLFASLETKKTCYRLFRDTGHQVVRLTWNEEDVLPLVPWYWTSGCSPHLKRRRHVNACSVILDIRLFASLETKKTCYRLFHYTGRQVVRLTWNEEDATLSQPPSGWWKEGKVCYVNLESNPYSLGPEPSVFVMPPICLQCEIFWLGTQFYM